MDIDEQHASALFRKQKQRCTGIFTLCGDLLRHLGLHVGRHTNETFDHLIALLLASILDFLQLDIGFLVGLFFGSLEATRVLLWRFPLA